MKIRAHPMASVARGVPIVGQQPPEGVHFYQVPVLIQRPGEPLEADSYEVQLAVPMQGAHVQAIQTQLAEELKAAAPDKAVPKVILLSPFFLGFVPKHAMDEVAARAAGNGGEHAEMAAPAAPEGAKPC